MRAHGSSTTDDVGSRQAHWDRVYAEKPDGALSWFETEPETSLALIAAAGVGSDAAVVDIGAGASRFVDALVARGFTDLTALDMSEEGLARTRARLGPAAERVRFVVADVTLWTPERRYGFWHDRAAFHFLTEPQARAAYLDRLRRAVEPGGHALISTFAADGPERCSGLPVARYDPEDLAATIGPDFVLRDSRRVAHRTPWGAEQRFQASLFRRT